MSGSGYAEINLISTNPALSITAFMSLFSAGLTVILGVYYRIDKQPLGNMVLSVNSANLVFFLIKISGFVHQPPDTEYCRLLLPIARGFINISLFMGTSFGHALYMIVKHQTMDIVDRMFKYYVLISVTAATAYSVSAAFTDFISYSETQKTCVHVVYFDKTDTLAIIYMTPTIVCCILAAVWYCLSGAELRKRGITMKKRDFIALIIYPGVTIFCWFPFLIVDFLMSIQLGSSQVLNVILANIYQLQGVLDALAYGAIPRIKQACQSWRKANKNKALDDTDDSLMHDTENIRIERKSVNKKAPQKIEIFVKPTFS